MNTKAKHPNKRVARSSPTATEQDSFHSLLQSALFGALCGIVVATLLLLAASAICHATNDPASFTGTAGLIALYLSALVAGFAALRRHRSMALVCGALSGIFLMLVFLCLSLLLRNHASSPLSSSQAWLLRALMIPTSAIGGYLGLSRKTPKKRHRHK